MSLIAHLFGGQMGKYESTQTFAPESDQEDFLFIFLHFVYLFFLFMLTIQNSKSKNIHIIMWK